jgi:molybdopterin-guanine dinucleotide biosynthesis protein A
MVAREVRKVDIFTADYKLATVGWERAPYDPFFNANRPEDLADAEKLAGV